MNEAGRNGYRKIGFKTRGEASSGKVGRHICGFKEVSDDLRGNTRLEFKNRLPVFLAHHSIHAG